MNEQEMITQLREISREHNPLRASHMQRHHPSLYRQVRKHFGSFHAALAAAEIQPVKRNSTWSPEVVKQEILARKTAGLSLIGSTVQKEAPALHRAGIRLLGSWRQAMEAAGLDYQEITPASRRDRTTLIKDLQAWSAAHGTVSPGNLIRTDNALYAALRKRFKTIEHAAEWAKVPFASKRRPYSQKEIFDEIRRREKKGLSLAAVDIQKEASRIYTGALSLFGTWSAAVEEYGLPYAEVGKHSRWTDERIESEARKHVEQHGHLDHASLAKKHSSLYSALCRKYGNLREAAARLNLPYRQSQIQWDKNRVLGDIRFRVHNRQSLSPSEVDRAQRKLIRAAITHFGSWKAAVEAAGFPYEHERAAIDIPAALREWHAKHGPLISSRISKESPSLYNAIRRKYGSTEAAAETLGLPFKTLQNAWSQEACLAALKERAAEGKSVYARDLTKEDARLAGAIKRHFGSWEEALTTAGIECQPLRRKIDVPLLLNEWSAKNGTLSSGRLSKDDPALFAAAQKRYGSLKEAAEALKIPFEERMTRWSKEKIVAMIQARAAAGHSLASGVSHQEERNLHNAATRYFGGWKQACKAAEVSSGA